MHVADGMLVRGVGRAEAFGGYDRFRTKTVHFRWRIPLLLRVIEVPPP